MKKLISTIVLTFFMLHINASATGDGLLEKYETISLHGDVQLPDMTRIMLNSLVAPPGSPSVVGAYPRKGLFFHFCPSYSRIYNKDIYQDNLWKSTGGFGYAVQLGYFMRLVKYIGLGIGVGVSSFQTELNIESSVFEFPSNDIDGDEFSESLQLSELTEKTVVSCLDIPVFLSFGNLNTANVSFFGSVGVKVSVPFNYNYTYDGSYSKEGYYSQYYVTLYDIPELGFLKNEPVTKTDDLNFNSIIFSATFSLGMSIPVSENVLIKLGGNLNIGFTEISADKRQDNYNESRYISNNNTLLTNNAGTTLLQSAGLEVGLIYILEPIY